MRVERAMRRIAAADDRAEDRANNERADREQAHEMYQKTLEALRDVEADDENEGVAVVADWIAERIETTGERPSSRAVRRRARQFCEANDYPVTNDSWLGR